MLATCATDDIIVETDADLMQLTQPSNKVPTEYSGALWNKAFRRDTVYNEYVLKGIFIERS